MDISALINSQRASSKNEEFTPATGWLNIGAEVDGTFISIGGIAIESLKPLKGSSEFAAAQRSLIQAVLAKFASLPEGQAIPIKLQVELRKVGEAATSNSLDIEWDL